MSGRTAITRPPGAGNRSTGCTASAIFGGSTRAFLAGSPGALLRTTPCFLFTEATPLFGVSTLFFRVPPALFGVTLALLGLALTLLRVPTRALFVFATNTLFRLPSRVLDPLATVTLALCGVVPSALALLSRGPTRALFCLALRSLMRLPTGVLFRLPVTSFRLRIVRRFGRVPHAVLVAMAGSTVPLCLGRLPLRLLLFGSRRRLMGGRRRAKK